MSRYDLDTSTDSARFLRDQEAAAWHDADRHDRHEYVPIRGGGLVDAAEAPDLADVADLGGR